MINNETISNIDVTIIGSPLNMSLFNIVFYFNFNALQRLVVYMLPDFSCRQIKVRKIPELDPCTTAPPAILYTTCYT
jgi:hypothetical protein